MIKKYTKKNGETAYKFVAYLGVDPVTGKQVRTTRQGFKTEREAKRAEVELINDYERNGGWKKSVNMTFDDVAQSWLEYYQDTVKPSTYMTTENYYKVRIKPVIGHLNIKKITVMSCQTLANELKHYASYTLILSIASRIFKFAVNMDLIDNDPMSKIIRPKKTHIPKSEYQDNYYNREELDIFLEVVKKLGNVENLAIFRILAYGGLRIGELLALENTDFNFIDNTISITKTVASTKNGYVIQTPKTKKSKRTIEMDNETMAVVKKHLATRPTKLHGSSRVFRLSPVSVRGRIKSIIAKNPKLKPISPHGFRHTHASLLYEAGIPVKVAQERLGHAKTSITLDLYTHLSKTQKNDAIGKLFKEIAL